MDEKKRKARNDALVKMELEQFAAERRERENLPYVTLENIEKTSDLLCLHEDDSGKLEDVLINILKQLQIQDENATHIFVGTARLLGWIKFILIAILLTLLFK